MTRETKLGLIIAGAFLALVGGVVSARMIQSEMALAAAEPEVEIPIIPEVEPLSNPKGPPAPPEPVVIPDLDSPPITDQPPQVVDVPQYLPKENFPEERSQFTSTDHLGELNPEPIDTMPAVVPASAMEPVGSPDLNIPVVPLNDSGETNSSFSPLEPLNPPVGELGSDLKLPEVAPLEPGPPVEPSLDLPPPVLPEPPTVELPMQEPPIPIPEGVPAPEQPIVSPLDPLPDDVPPPVAVEIPDAGMGSIEPPAPPPIEVEIEPPPMPMPVEPNILSPQTEAVDLSPPMPLPEVEQPERRDPPQNSTAVSSYDEDLHTVRLNETYDSISLSRYDDPVYGRALFAYNRDNPTGRGDPDRLLVDQKVRIPPLWVLQEKYPELMPRQPGQPQVRQTAETAPLPKVAPQELAPIAAFAPPVPITDYYTVEATSGESIREIARRTLGSGEAWQRIWELNRAFDPNEKIPQGTKLRLPPEARR